MAGIGAHARLVTAATSGAVATAVVATIGWSLTWVLFTGSLVLESVVGMSKASTA